MFDPDEDPQWIGGARSVERLTPGAVGVGSRVRRHGGFLGPQVLLGDGGDRHGADRLLDMRFVEGPMEGGVSYLIRPSPDGSVVAIRNYGYSKIPVPGMSWLVRRSVAADLRRLATLVEENAK